MARVNYCGSILAVARMERSALAHLRRASEVTQGIGGGSPCHTGGIERETRRDIAERFEKHPRSFSPARNLAITAPFFTLRFIA